MGNSPKALRASVPPLPAAVWSVLGPVPVVVVEGLKDDKGNDLFGQFDPGERVVKIRAGIHPTTALCTCVHEWVHVVMWDAGLNLPDAIEEQVADCLSSAIVADMLSQGKP